MAESSNVSSQESFINHRTSERGEQEQQQQQQLQQQQQQLQQQRQFQPHNASDRERSMEIPAAKVSILFTQIMPQD